MEMTIIKSRFIFFFLQFYVSTFLINVKDKSEWVFQIGV